MRMGGIASGMDTEALVQALLEAERIPKYRLETKVAETQDKLAAWTQLDAAVSSLYSKTQALTSYSNWQRMSVAAGSSGIVGATATVAADPATYDIHVEYLAASHRLASDPQASTAEALSLSGDFTIGGQPITVESTDTLSSIRDKINTASANMATGDKVSATIINSSLVIKRQETGDTQISLADGASGVLKSLGILDASDLVKNELQAARNLSATIDGIAIDSSANTNLSSIVNGLTLSFTATGDSTLTVSHDTTFIRGMIDDFIATYNSTMQAAEEQTKVTLSEGDEAISRGLLQGENLAVALQQKSRAFVTNRVTDPGALDQAFNSLQTIGIWTESRDNRLAITDSVKLEDALTNNFALVEDLFRDYEGGIARKLDGYLNSLTSPIDGSIVARTTNMQTSITDMYDEMDKIDARILRLEDQLWEQFARMEDAMASINNQGSFLLAALGMDTGDKKK